MSRIPHNTTKIFTDVWDNVEDFKQDYLDSGLPPAVSFISNKEAYSQSSMDILFYLLYARYGNSAIANLDEHQWKYRVFATIFQYGPTWEKRLEIQEKLRELDLSDIDGDLFKGTKAIYNHAFNPGDYSSEKSGTETQPELAYVNDQNVTNYKKSKMDAYTQLWDLLATDVTNEFINKFSGLFAKFVHTRPDLYITELDEEGEE